MKVVVQTTALNDALALLGPIASGRTPRPVLQCVKLIAADGALTLMATDMEIAARVRVSQVEISAEGQALIPANRLSSIVRECMEDSLTLDVAKETCTITGSGSRFTIYGFDPAEFPPVAEMVEPDAEVSAELLNSMIGRTLFATAREHSRYAISGVLWELEDRKVRLVATDGRRLALSRGALVEPTTKEASAIVPTKLMNLIKNISAGSQQNIAIQITETQMLVRSADAVLAGNLVQGNFPKYSDVIPQDSTCKATLNKATFLHQVRQAALLTNEESKGIRLSFADGELTVTSRAPETGEAEIKTAVDFTGDAIAIGFNPTYLADALKVVDVDDVTLEMSASNKPGLLKGGPDFLYVLMPVGLD